LVADEFLGSPNPLADAPKRVEDILRRRVKGNGPKAAIPGLLLDMANARIVLDVMKQTPQAKRQNKQRARPRRDYDKRRSD
jgi:hypothetical protein